MAFLVKSAMASLLVLSFLSCLAIEAVARRRVPDPVKPVQHVAVLLVNESGSKIRADLLNIPLKNAATRQVVPESVRIGAFKRCRFFSGRTDALLQFSIYLNGRKVAETSFGPFHDTGERKVSWNGARLVLE
jgi:hypothetical protein